MPHMQQTYTSHPPDAVGIGIMLIAALIGLVVFFAILAVLCYFIAEHYKIIPAGARKKRGRPPPLRSIASCARATSSLIRLGPRSAKPFG